MHLRPFRPGLAALLLALAAAPALAEGLDARALERELRTVADHAIPRTVLVKAMGEGGQGAGSGAIISPDGFILTCSHVIEIGDRIEVVTPDGKSLPAKVVGRNKRQDFALIKVEAQGLPAFALGDSDSVKAGDWVVALGHPGGPYPDVQPAFAAGKVRALHVKLPVGMMQKYYNDAIMTDCPIFAGDSGGPLVNLKGELVGINGAIVMINEFAFAVPLKQIQAQLDGLKQGQTIEGEPPGPDAWKEMSKVVSPEDYQKVMRRAMKNLPKLFGGKDNPFGDLFGENSPFKDLFGGQGGQGLDLQKMMEQMFGGQGGPGGGEMPDLQKMMEQMFGGQGGKPGEMPDLQKMMEQLFGGQGGPGGGEMPDLQKMMEQLFGGRGGNPGEAPDLQKMMEQLFGGRDRGGEQPRAPRQGETPAQKPAQGGFLGVRAAQQQGGAPGVLIDQVVEGGPAAQGGLVKGDCIVSVDGVATPTMDALKGALAGKGAGTAIKVVVERTTFVDTVPVTERKALSVTLGARQ